MGYTVYTFHNAIKVGENNINNNNKNQETFKKGSRSQLSQDGFAAQTQDSSVLVSLIPGPPCLHV